MNARFVTGSVLLILWLLITLESLSLFNVFSTGAALGPMQAEWLSLPWFLVVLALALLVLAYRLITSNSGKALKRGFILFLIAPYTVFVAYNSYLVLLVAAAPFFTEHKSKKIELRLALDEQNRPVFFFKKFHIKNGFDYDPYRKYITKYPEPILKLSETEQTVNGTMIVEYTYNRATAFWLTYIEGMPVQTNRIDGSQISHELKLIENQEILPKYE